MNLSEAKQLTDSPGDYPYDRAHREASRAEQEEPCTCQRAAKERTGGALYPSLIEPGDADPDCELHFPWMIEDDRERVTAMRWWFAGYHVGFDTASAEEEGDPPPAPRRVFPAGINAAGPRNLSIAQPGRSPILDRAIAEGEDASETFRSETRRTLHGMSDAAIGHQLGRAAGGIEGEEIEAESRRRGITGEAPWTLSTTPPESEPDLAESGLTGSVTPEDLAAAADAVELLAGIDDGENTDGEALLALAERLRDAARGES